ncbi:acyltransferase [Paenarthrobacter nicotinovorans]|uniref:acyltransferase n=1 Tax=Paenarthrobacter nicotinovorans TaxID=29320 RepID=UPI003D678C5F
MEADKLIRDQNLSTPTRIGADVWVARGCAVLRGTTIGDKAVIGANSVARGTIEEGTINVGSPARAVKQRI